MSTFKILFCIFFIVIGVASFLYYYRKTRDILNPFGIVLGMWCIVAGIANLNLSRLEKQWDAITYIVVLLFPLIIFLVASVGRINLINKNDFQRVELSNCYILCSRIVFVVCLVCAYIEFKSQGYSVTLFVTLDEGADIKSTIQSIPIWHYGTLFLPYCSICAFYELCYSKIKNKLNIIYLLLELIIPILHSLFIAVSRGTLLVIILGIIYIASRKIKIKIPRLAAIIIAVIVVFVQIMQVRVDSGSLVYNVIEGHPIISSIYSYTALNFNNLNLLVLNGSSWSIVNRTFGGITQLLGIYRLFNEPSTYTTAFFNATPICYSFYDDLGILGVVVYSYIIYKIVKRLYNKSNADQNYMILYASLQKAIWMSIFGNYFCEFRVALFPYIVLFIMTKLMNVRFKVFAKSRRISMEGI